MINPSPIIVPRGGRYNEKYNKWTGPIPVDAHFRKTKSKPKTTQKKTTKQK